MKDIDIRNLTRNDVVPYYIELINSNPTIKMVLEVNNLILSKWSSSGLNYIKVNAWRRLGVKAIEKSQ